MSDEISEHVIRECSYINKVNIPSNKADDGSFSFLTEGLNLTQSQNIKLGICMQEFVTIYAEKVNVDGWENSPIKNEKDEKEKDIIFKNKNRNEIIYCEAKNNINLDTEKLKATEDKINHNIEKIRSENPGYHVDGYLLACRYLDNDEEIAKHLISKYKNVNVIGINNYLKLFNITDLIKDYDNYKKIIRLICKTKFNIS